MKVLLCEACFAGHRKRYLEWLADIPEIEFYLYAPGNVGLAMDHFIPYDNGDDPKSLKEYLVWIKKIRDTVVENKIDVVHILDGDSIMRFFGLGFTSLGAKQLVITYHHFFPGRVREISYRAMGRGDRTYCIAHTASVQHALKQIGIKRVVKCEYPAFNFDRMASMSQVECKETFHVPQEVPTIGIVGGMSAYKNIIPFLEAMAHCKEAFHLLICGRPCDVTEAQIQAATASYADKVTMVIRSLTDQEYEQAIVACDIIYCIYGHDFDGASGPLTDGVCAKKLILSCKHGSLGEIVSQNLLGITAECDDGKEMLKQTELALSRAKDFKYSDMANRYRESLNPCCFIERYRTVYFERR